MSVLNNHIDSIIKLAKDNKCGVKVILDISPIGEIKEQLYLGTEASFEVRHQTGLLNKFLSEISKTNGEGS